MSTLEQSIYLEITEKLKDAPQDILERVLGYVDGILEKNRFQLTDEQKKSLTEIKNRPYSEHKEANSFLNDLGEKYGI